MNTRGCGVLLPLTSLPSRFGIGDLGPEAERFVRFLTDAGQRYWQILPLHPTDPAYDNSPYHALSAFAGNTLLISPERMVGDGFLDPGEIGSPPGFPAETTDYDAVIAWKERIFAIAGERFSRRAQPADFTRFCERNAEWLGDYALFSVLRRRLGPARWGDWPDGIRTRQPDEIDRVRKQEEEAVFQEQFLQYLFSIQWDALREYCREQGILLIGDIPIYVDYDSADVWTRPGLFSLGPDLKPESIAGVPPDYFSRTGQVWGSPVYRWDEIRKTGFSWWISRVEHLLTRVDHLRIDHFRGLVAFWEIPAGSETAVNGRWTPAPGDELILALSRRFACLPVIAEDLGVITPDVSDLMRRFAIPGMKVLLFAFGDGMPTGPHIPHQYPPDCIVYTGTHDNNPVRGWYAAEATETEKVNLARYSGTQVTDGTVGEILIRLAMMSGARTAIIPIQDLLGLGEESRINRPGTESGNWRWRVLPGQISDELAGRMREMAIISGRY